MECFIQCSPHGSSCVWNTMCAIEPSWWNTLVRASKRVEEQDLQTGKRCCSSLLLSCLPVLYKADLLQVRWVMYLFANLLSNCRYPLQVATKGPFRPYVSSPSSTLPWTHDMTLLNIILQDQNSRLYTSKGIGEQNTGHLLEAWKLALRFYGYPDLAQYFHNCNRLTYCVEPTHLALKKNKTIRVHHAPMQSKLQTQY